MAEMIAEEVRIENPEADHETLKQELDAKTKATTEDDAQLRADGVILKTRFTNLYKEEIHRIDRHFWAGSVLTDRKTITGNHYTILSQKGTQADGVKWGQVWANGDDTTARKWVVAFDTKAGKAYAEAGPIGPVDWNVVEVKLGMSESKSDYTDPILGGRTVAEINGLEASATFR